MILGSSAKWTQSFRRYEERLLDRIVDILPSCAAVLGSCPHEDAITYNLVERLRKDHKVRRMFHWLDTQFYPFATSEEGVVSSTGAIDFVAHWDWEREKYLAYEAKRLNVPTKNGRQSNAKAYVTEGVVRFVTGQYSKYLPVGCMLGYVLDGDVKFADKKVKNAIADHQISVGLCGGPSTLTKIGGASRFETDHRREHEEGEINIRHTLISYV